MVGFFITAMQISTAQAEDDILTNPCMAVPAGPDRDACNSSVNALSADPMAPPPGAPGMPPGMPGGDIPAGEEEPPLDDDALEDLFHPPEEDEPDDAPLGDGTEIPPDPADAQ